jgi:uncharacterized protein (TIGR00661 family)
MKILYGVVGEGMGHATRSRVILNHLVKNHEVQIVVSGRAHAYLSRYFLDVVEIQGLHMAYENNEVDRSRTFWELLKGLPSMLSENFEAFIRMSERFQPDVVISDFESFAYTFGQHHALPVISIDNMQILNRCELEVDIPEQYADDFQIAKAIVKGKLPGCYHYLITTFFFPPIRKERTGLFPPILRDEVLAAPRTVEDHLLVYQTATTNEALLKILEEVRVPCRVYGFGRSEKLSEWVQLRAFSEDGFIRDLASCRGVLATGGFSLMGEAVYLGKPLLAVPLRKQFEQILNALYLKRLGYGEYHDALTPEAVRGFMGRLDGYAAALRNHHQDGNTLILSALDGLLEEARRGDGSE